MHFVFLSCWNVIAWTSWGFGSDNSSVLQSKLIKHRWMSHWNALIDNNQQMWKWSIGQLVNGHVSPLHRGRLGLMVGFPSMWLEIYPVWMEFQPLDGNPSSGWKSHQGLVGFPSICPKMAGWKSNHPWAKARPKNFKKLYGPTMQSSQNGVYLGGVGVKLPLFLRNSASSFHRLSSSIFNVRCCCLSRIRDTSSHLHYMMLCLLWYRHSEKAYESSRWKKGP